MICQTLTISGRPVLECKENWSFSHTIRRFSNQFCLQSLMWFAVGSKLSNRSRHLLQVLKSNVRISICFLQFVFCFHSWKLPCHLHDSLPKTPQDCILHGRQNGTRAGQQVAADCSQVDHGSSSIRWSIILSKSLSKLSPSQGDSQAVPKIALPFRRD